MFRIYWLTLPKLQAMAAPCFKTIIAGPCSAESAGLCLETAASLTESGLVDIFRAGIWKPRTMSGQYEGPGAEGLKYLAEVRSQYGLPIATEAATAAHVDACLKAEIDYIWIGARTVTDPFSVQELADALQNTSIKVMVKNPLVPDIRLWAGATERLLKNGVRVQSLIHRGFSVYEQSVYRNEPLWALVPEMRRLFPALFVIADPSHMAGKSAYIATLAAQALEMEVDGLMIEVHPHPNSALSDAAQQITPEQFTQILSAVCERHHVETGGVSLGDLRSEIDSTDEKILKLLAQRMSIVHRLGNAKKEAGLTMMQSERWMQVVEQRLRKGTALGLNPIFIHDILKVIHDESLRIQMELLDNKGDGK